MDTAIISCIHVCYNGKWNSGHRKRIPTSVKTFGWGYQTLLADKAKYIALKRGVTMQGITIRYLQDYSRSKNMNLENREALFLKLSEEVGELAKAMLQNPAKATETTIKGTIEEELCDVIAGCICIANSYEIDIERWIPIKEKIHNEKYRNNVVFDPK